MTHDEGAGGEAETVIGALFALAVDFMAEGLPVERMIGALLGVAARLGRDSGGTEEKFKSAARFYWRGTGGDAPEEPSPEQHWRDTIAAMLRLRPEGCEAVLVFTAPGKKVPGLLSTVHPALVEGFLREAADIAELGVGKGGVG